MSTLQIVVFTIVLPIFVWGSYWVIHDLYEWLIWLGWIKTPEYKAHKRAQRNLRND